MRQSQLFTKTRKEAPKDEVSRNAELLIRAGYVHKEMAGVYSFLPLGLRTLDKICNIIREEMNAIGGQELQLTALQDKKVWETTGRWNDAVVDNWFKTKLKNDTELGLGFTHEEPLTALMKSYIRSVHDLPVYTYQIQTKFRNETRAKSGIMRGREFLMKDLYSFSRSAEEHAIFYEKTKTAYMNVFRRVGLGDNTFVTFASGGSFSKYSHEFQTVTEAGEDIIFIDSVTKEAWNKEVATGIVDNKNLIEEEEVMKEVEAKRKFSVNSSCKFHNCEPWRVLKSFVFVGEKSGIGIAVIRGDLEVNELLLSHLVSDVIRPATADELSKNGFVQGFISPVNLNMSKGKKYKIYGDESLKTVHNYNTGANIFERDVVHVNVGRDFEVHEWGNFAVPITGFKSPSGNDFKIEKAVEVGNIFSLGTRFSEPLELNYLDIDGKNKPVVMGSYGLGPSRVMGVIAEILSDEKGIVWPEEVAPFSIHLIVLHDKDGKNGKVAMTADKLYADLTASGKEVLYDDRDQRAGEKFADSDLIGIPTRIVLSEKTLTTVIAGSNVPSVEVKNRKTGEMVIVPIEKLVI